MSRNGSASGDQRSQEEKERVLRLWKEFSTALHVDQFDDARAVLERAGADRRAVLRETSADGRTQLHTAIAMQRLDRVNFLLECGADVEATVNGNAALYLASETGNIEVVQALLGRGADIDRQNPVSKNNALIAAICKKNELMALFLIERGAKYDDETKSATGAPASSYALRMDLPQVTLALVAKGGFYGEPLQRAVSENALKVAEACLRHPELRASALDENRLEGLLEICRGDAMHQLLLSWRSERAISAAIDDNAETSAPEVTRRRNIGLSL